MNHRINRYLKALPYTSFTANGFPSNSEDWIRTPVCPDQYAYWGLIKLHSPQRCRGIGFCLSHETAKYGIYGDRYESQD